MSSKNRGAESVESDFYATPVDCTRAMLTELLPHFDMHRSLGKAFRILEPTAGKGAIVKVLREFFPEASITAVELDRKRFEELEASGLCDVTICGDYAQQDFAPEQFHFAPLNPPFTIAQSIVGKAIHDAKHACALLRLGFLGSAKRRPWWRQLKMDPLYLAERPSFAASLKCQGHVTAMREKIKPCGWAVIQELEAPRPKRCPACLDGTVSVSTSDSADYMWAHFWHGARPVRVL